MHSISLILDKNKILIFNVLHICYIEEKGTEKDCSAVR